ncbi:hypothetical protein [Paenibacillus taichungensis]|uniref:hypothetical protein n=1 Tax=Paenibacillus taichungensis TaxID=484184 RepID=UPI0039A02D7E
MWIIGIEKYPKYQVVIQIVDLEKGKYLTPKTIRASNLEQFAEELVLSILHSQPNKIIFDEFYDGKFFKEVVLNKLELIRFKIDTDGSVLGYFDQNHSETPKFKFY